MLQHLKWRSLEDRRRDARLVMMYKMEADQIGPKPNQPQVKSAPILLFPIVNMQS